MARMVVVLACLALAACGGVKKTDDAGNASGRVLAGSISDAMIDLDRSRAEAPLAGPGTGGPAAPNEAARDLLVDSRADRAGAAGAAASDAPSQDQTAKAPTPADAAVPRDKIAEKASAPVPAATKAPAGPAAVTPTKPKAKPAFRKPTDDGGV